MPNVELARRDNVELIRTGSWPALTGTWNPSKKDLTSAIEAMRCPAVGKPLLKIGHLDKRFTPGISNDGEPSIGWVDNLRAGENGELLLGDYVGMPAWIDQIMASAWPKRSIEGKYNYRCALNHKHDFALEAVSLLGATPPAISTLRSLNDVAELYGVDIAAASGDSNDGNPDEHVYAVVAAAEVHTSAMIALIPTVEDAERLALEGGEPANELHLTLAYLGEAAALGAGGRQDVIDQVSTVANGLPRLQADIFAATVFNPGPSEPGPCLVWGVTGDMIDAVHDLVDDTLDMIDAPIPSQLRPWNAHITAAYTGDLGRLGELAAKVGPVTFDRLRLAFAGEFIDIPLMDWPGEEPADDADVAAAAGDHNSLHDYWTTGPGLAKWRDRPHPWTALYRELRKHLSSDRAKRTASAWYLEVTGHTPNQKVAAAAVTEVEPMPELTEPAATEPLDTPPADVPAPELPAAEPEQENPDPKEEDPVSTTDLSPIGSRLGLNGDISVDSIAEAIDALKAKAEAPPTVIEPAPELVAASAAAAERTAELEKTVEKLAGQLTSISTELAAAKQEKADTVKASVIQAAAEAGKFTPADREQWERDYDEAPGVTTRILASIAPGTAVPVTASGVTGEAEPVLASGMDVPAGSALDAWAKQLGIDVKELSY